MPIRMDNDGQHVVYIYDTTECKKHAAEQGSPCWTVLQPDTGRYLPALCGTRIKKAGFVGRISASSMARTGRPKPRQS